MPDADSQQKKAKHVLFGRTTDAGLHRRLRLQAIVEGRTVSEIIEEALRCYFDGRPLDLEIAADLRR